MGLITLIQESPPLLYLVVTVFGLIIGSFLNVVILRLPVMMDREWRRECSLLLDVKPEADDKPFNLITPRSRCPHCNHMISALENIPVLSYLALGGKCKNCRKRISPRYPAVELTSCLLAVAVAVVFGATIQTLFAILLTWTLIVLAVIDLDHQLLPDNITLPFLWLGIAINMFGVFTDTYSSLLGAMTGYLVLWTVYIAFKLVTGKEGMGHGDFKLMAMLGAWLGWQMLPLIVILSSLVGTIVGVFLIMTKGMERSQTIPFGPYIAMAGWIALLFGDGLVRLYLNWAVN